ncbi:putative lysine-specific demethylase JMJ16 isoform X2 [Mangifera indica]|uniref:putative lysine-specific demethylase JMJ16 isoform X2 n=1 Tax=Mangifera indica TaxID=29780 RepID=UPI001CFADF44|nr:putative lysine-specific demethylase JMJ16 isoform X2 [Mangifera indica]
MGTELVRISVKEENDEVPPGFESYAVFTLKRVQDTEKHDSDIKSSCSASASASESQQIQVETDVGDSDGVKTRSLRRRPWINYGQFGHSSDDESDYRKLGQNFTVKPRLPKGVIRGCPGCSDCQKITARWRPEGARRPVLEDAPVFYPTAEEFEDTLKYIASIRPKAEPYGICRIVPPPSWKPPCPLKEKHKWESSTFVTRVQRVDKLQNRHSMRKISKFQNHTRRKRRRCTKMAMDYGTDSGNFPGSGFGGCFEDERFGFEPGPEFTLNKFQKYADFFKAQYFSRNRNDIQNMGVNTTTDQEHWEPSVENIEGEYWRIVEKATEEIEVLYGADLETGVFGSGFPKLSIQVGSSSDDRYIKSGWNLNNFPRLPGSVLTYESGDISGVLVPWLYIGMCFSSFCWHVEDHHLYSLNYMHWGAPKMWYGVPGNSAVKLEETMKKHLPDLFEEQPDLLHKLTRVEMEHVGREYFCNSSLAMKMDSNFDATSERECSVCLFDLHLSAVGCHCSSDKYACLNHAKNFCSCDWSAKFFLFRYDISELNILVEALEGKLSAVYRWARLDLGLALSSYFSRDNMQVDNLYHSNDGKVQKELKSQLSEAGIFGLMSFQQNNNPSEASLPMKDMKTSPTSDGTSYGIERKNSNLKLKTEESIHLASSLGHPACQFSPEDMSNNAEQADQKSLLDKSLVLGSTTVILLSDDEDDEPKEAVSKRSTGSSVKNVELSGRLASSEDKASTCNHDKDPVLFASITDAALMSQKDLCSVSDVQRLNYSSSTMLKKDEHHPDGGKLLGSNPPEFSCPVGSTHEESGRILSGSTISGETSCPNVQNAASNLQHLPPCDNGKSNNEDSHENLGTTSSSNLVSSERTNSGNPSCSQNSLDRCFRQKGPRIAKVVRRINCNVEALEYGVVLPGKFWCNSQAIFPKGFRSRVRYISILDPTNMCYYVSEILDVERDRPLFMVSLEQSLSEVFVHVSAARCWEMVRDRVNQEIAKQHKLGRSNLPPLQPPGSLDGFEMFGFSSPAIVQAIEAMDHNRVCLEYWDSRPYSRAQMQIQQPSQNSSNLSRASGEQNNRDSSGSHLLPVGADTILRGLFKKATNAELHSLYSILNDNRPEADRFLLTRLLIEEIHNRPR